MQSNSLSALRESRGGRFDALDVYLAYPVAPLLLLEKPHRGETIAQWIARIGMEQLDHCEDGLFSFVIYELRDCETAIEAYRRIGAAISDLRAVQRVLSERIRDASEA